MTVTVICSPAGGGKTTALAEKIAHADRNKHIEVYVPTHALAVEWKGLIQKFNPSCRVSIIGGRNHIGIRGSPLCSRNQIAAQITKAGQSVYTRLCRSNSGGQCSEYDRCAYIDQFAVSHVSIYTHAYLPLDRGILDAVMPDIVVIDESFFSVCLKKFEFDIALLNHSALPPATVKLCSEIASNLQLGVSLYPLISNAGKKGGGLRSVVALLRKSAPKPQPNQSDQQVVQILKSAPNFESVACLLDHLLGAFKNKQLLQSVDYEKSTGLITVHHRRDITRFKPTSKKDKAPDIYLLDATADRKISEVFFPGAKFKEFRLERNAFIVQCRSTVCSTASFDPTRHSSPDSIAKAVHKLSELQQLIDELSLDNKKVLVVGPTAITGNPGKNVLPSVNVSSHCALAHFSALRGVDAWKDFDTVVVVGRNQPSTAAVEDMARALFFDDPVPLNLSGQWTRESRGYRLRTGAEGVDVEVHPDIRVQAVLEQIRESESLQALDRLRLIHCSEPKLVVILSNIPLDVDVDELLTWDELIHGSRIDRALRLAGSVFPLSQTWLAAKFPQFWKTSAAAKKDVQRTFKKGHFINKYSIYKLSLLTFKYRAGGQRRWSYCLGGVEDPAAVSAALSGVLGHPVTVAGPIPAPT